MSTWLRVMFFVGDLILLNLSILISLAVYGSPLSVVSSSASMYLISFSNIAWLFLVMVSSPYNVNKGWTIVRTLKSQVVFIAIHLLVVASLSFFFRQSYPPGQIALIYGSFLIFFTLFRAASFYLRKVLTKEISQKNFIIVGRNALGSDIRKFYMMNPESGYRFKGYVDFPGGAFSIQPIEAFCQANEVHEIFCCFPDVTNEQMRSLVNFGMNSLIKVKLVTAGQNHSVSLDQFEKLPGQDYTTIPLDEVRNQIIKRVFDIVFSFTFTVLVLSWLIPIIGILIKIDSRGPIFFLQQRSGKDNKPFWCIKFRTMVMNAQADTQQATRGDKRITRLGHFLRSTSIDELPQFLNVLVGTMSVVGPRPHMLKHTDEYSKLIEHFMGRHYVKAGITGLAQCLGYRGETKNISDMENRVRMDRYYIENWTFWFDIKIIFLTVVSLIRGSDKAF